MQLIKAYNILTWGGKHFHSPTMEFEWLPGWNVISNGPFSVDEYKKNGVYGKNGFYSLKERPTGIYVYPCVVELEIAGHIVEYEKGYRSEFARIVRVVDWQTGWGDAFSYNRINWLYESNNSTDRCKSTWPKMTPYTKVFEMPPNSNINRYNFPIMAEPMKASFDPDGEGGFLVPYRVLTIELDKAHRDSRGYYVYGYNAERDICVYRRLDD